MKIESGAASVCEICPHYCAIEEGRVGFCRGRGNVNGKITCLNYGKITSLALDPTSKKPLKNFFPGSMILSAGSFGCNMRCDFCQNHSISMANSGTKTTFISPETLVEEAIALIPDGNIGVAFTYNEPLISYEYIKDCAKILRENQLKTVLVTNGLVNEKPLTELLPFVDAMNIDLKCFSEEFYKELSGDLNTVKRTIELANEQCHVEVTTLIIPGKNDGIEEIAALSEWLGGVNCGIPLHLSRYFPRYKYEIEAATAEKLFELREIARKSLDYVYVGNV
ncbi:MAG: AmmeMemoRadiSam system radical SAM enzyme [Oscillospiraceae bacterium]|nr:AmmeMemoRadiSam system radical SAM enzyme [Oscillospiraceae bacterium]